MSITPTFTEPKVKSFVSESQIEEEKRKRQEEWERVRKPDQPLVLPEEPVDNRCLYEKLKEQKDRKQEQFDEEHKFKNQIRGLNSEETGFLTMVSERQMELLAEKEKEERELIQEYKEFKKGKPYKEPVKSSSTSKPTSSSSSSSSYQSQLLAGAVKRKKSSEDQSNIKKSKANTPEKDNNKADTQSGPESPTTRQHNTSGSTPNHNDDNNNNNSDAEIGSGDKNNTTNHTGKPQNKLTVVGYLPGMVDYSSSDESHESSSSSDSEVESSLILKRVIIRDGEKCVRAGHQH